MNWQIETIEAVFEKLKSNAQGLSKQEASERLIKYGKNILAEKKRNSFFSILLLQFRNQMIIILLVAAVVSGIAGDINDTIIIALIVFLNAVIGALQEHKAENALNALKKIAGTSALVKRDNTFLSIPASELVPGDIVVLNTGDMIPADLRLTECNALKINEASLTGESLAVEKKPAALQTEEVAIGDRINMAFKGSLVVYGRGIGIVVTTGMETQIGSVAKMLSQEETQTPLQKRLNNLSKKLSVIVLAIAILIFIHGLLRGEEAITMLLTAIAIAVAAIPEALPAVITIALALGAKKMLKKNVIIRKLTAVETLGSVTYICTDKTGTLTQNKMAVQEIWTNTQQKIFKQLAPLQSAEQLLLLCIALNNDTIAKDENQLMGDPTEIALFEFAQRDVFTKKELNRLPRVFELPFDSERKMMTTVHDFSDVFLVVTKGAVESVAKACNDPANKKMRAHAENMASKGLRVIAYSCKLVNKSIEHRDIATLERNQFLIGLVGMMDPPRLEVASAVNECKVAGIIPVMITGDHSTTAKAIAIETGIVQTKEDLVITGSDLSKLTSTELNKNIQHFKVYARVSPQQKLQIVKTLQEQHQFVAMTGDGVNDAPALKQADIGIAMGIMGTDVSKEAAKMILMDDNFATIIEAVKEGRRIYANIRKFIQYVLTCNFAEVGVIFLAPFLSLPLPLLPIQILWINLVTDSLPGLALSVERAEEDLMNSPPRNPKEEIFTRKLVTHILWTGLFMAAVCLFAQKLAISEGNARWQSIVFTVLCFTQMANILAIKSNRFFLLNNKFFDNPFLWLSVVVTVALQMSIMYIPFLQKIFHTQALSLQELLFCFSASSSVFFAMEIGKLLRKKNKILKISSV